MSICESCGKDYGKASYQFCLDCGKRLVTSSESPTVKIRHGVDMQRTVKRQGASKKDSSVVTNLQTENELLKHEIEQLKRKTESVFGSTTEPAQRRVDRILSITGFNTDNLGTVTRVMLDSNGDTAYKREKLPFYLGNFRLYQQPAMADDQEDLLLYVSVFETTDLETELADIRVLLEECADKDLGCTFVLATNDNLRQQRSRLTTTFRRMRTYLRRQIRNSYSLKIWDESGLIERENFLGIRISPNSKKQSKPTKK
jgi:hypothetical protein